jgi:DDE superfamily endonuclease
MSTLVCSSGKRENDMDLLINFLMILSHWTETFSRKKTFKRALCHAISSLCALGRHTITNILTFAGKDDSDWSAEYKVFSRSKWDLRSLFRPIIHKSLYLFEGRYVFVAIDDTKLKKTGKKIKSASWQRDSLSPPFWTNLVFGLRFLQISLLPPLHKLYGKPCRSLPICFKEVPVVKKPGKKATEEEWEEYKREIKKKNLSQAFVESLKETRKELDNAGGFEKILVATCDGSFCNKVCIGAEMERTHLVARCRKNAKLCVKASGGRAFYSKEKFTPEQVRQDESIPWQEATIFHGGDWRKIRYKEVNHVLWQNGAKRKFLRLIVIAPTPYKLTKKGKILYRQPAYLLVTDTESLIEEYVQAYFDRWQIEVNHREEKDTLGVGEAQIRNEKSVSRHPAFRVAVYSALLLASIISFRDTYTEDFNVLPSWRKKKIRPSCLDLIHLLRKQIIMNPKVALESGIYIDLLDTLAKSAA